MAAHDAEDDPTRWRTVAETAAHFHVGKNAVYEGCKTGGWPHRRNGKHRTAPILFDPVEDWPIIAELLRPASVHVPAARVPSTAQLDRGMRRMLARTNAQTKPPA